MKKYEKTDHWKRARSDVARFANLNFVRDIQSIHDGNCSFVLKVAVPMFVSAVRESTLTDEYFEKVKEHSSAYCLNDILLCLTSGLPLGRDSTVPEFEIKHALEFMIADENRKIP